MNSVTAPPPGTSLTDVIALFGLSLLMAVLLHLIRGQKLRLAAEVALICKRCAISEASPSEISDDLVSNVRRFHLSVGAFALSWLPFLVLVIGYTLCSLLRDAGYLIFPWPLLGVSLLFGFAFWAGQRIRMRVIERRISGRLNQPASPTRRVRHDCIRTS